MKQARAVESCALMCHRFHPRSISDISEIQPSKIDRRAASFENMSFTLRSRSLLICSVLLGSFVFCVAQPSPAPGPSAAASVNSGNTTESIAFYCSNRANLQSLLASPSNQASVNLGVTIPANLSDVNNIQTIAQVHLMSSQRHRRKGHFSILRHVHAYEENPRAL